MRPPGPAPRSCWSQWSAQSHAHPISLFQAKYAAGETLRANGIPWTILRSTAFIETWATIMTQSLRATGKIPVFGRGDNPVNFVSAADVAALPALAVTHLGHLRGQVLELGAGRPDLQPARRHRPGNQRAPGHGRAHPAAALLTMTWLTAATRPALARRARAVLTMDTLDMTFDHTPDPAGVPDLPGTDIRLALKALAESDRRERNPDDLRVPAFAGMTRRAESAIRAPCLVRHIQYGHSPTRCRPTGRPGKPGPNQVPTPPDSAGLSQTSPDIKVALKCGNRTQRDAVRRNHAAWHAEGQGFESP
jgi:hypothetical protein